MRTTHLSRFFLTLLLLLPSALIASSDLRTPQTETTQVKVVAKFYSIILTFKDGGIPSKKNIDKLSPLISRSFRQHLLDALAGEPRSVEGSLFYSLFEGADRMRAIVLDKKFGPNSFLVSLEYGDPKKGKDQFAQWQDRAVLINENNHWVVDDLHLLGDWQFGAKGKLSEILHGIAKTGAYSNTPQLPEESATSRIQIPVDFSYLKGNKIYIQRVGQAQPELWIKSKSSTPYSSISPSGKEIAFTLESNGKKSTSRSIAVQGSPAGKPRVIYGTPEYASYGPRWSPDGELIMFNNGQGIAVVSKDGTGYHDILLPKSPHQELSAATWAADGKSVYVADWECMYHLRLNGELIESFPFNKYSIELNSAARFSSLHSDGHRLLLSFPADFPDMEQFGYTVDVIYLLDLKTGEATRVSPVGVMANEPVWLPDGKSFLFTGTDKTKSGIYKMDLESKKVEAIVQDASEPGLASQTNSIK